MPNRVDNAPHPADIGEHPASESREVVGSFRGERVSVAQDAVSLVAEAARELVLHAGEVARTGIEDRKVQGSGQSEKTEDSTIDLYLRMAGDIDAMALVSFFNRIREDASPPSIQGYIQQARRSFADVTHQYLALSFARDLLRQEGRAEESRSALQAAGDYLMETSGAEVRSGLNADAAVSEFSALGLGGAQELRDFYRGLVLRYEGVDHAFEGIMRHFEAADFNRAVAFLMKAVGGDLASKGPSISPVELKAVMDDLYNLEALANLHESCSEACARMQALFAAPVALAPSELVNRLLKLKEEKAVGAGHLASLLAQMGIQGLDAKIHFMQEVKEMVRLIPPRLYSNPENRSNLMSAVQEALDGLIGMEK